MYTNNTNDTAIKNYIPYGCQTIDESDFHAVIRVLQSDWLTTGPMVGKFERAVAEFSDAKYAVAVSSGTAALHSAMYAADIGPGDEVIIPAMTFAATANAVVFVGGTPVFADVDSETLLIDPKDVEKKITPRTKAIIAVDYAGHPCDYNTLNYLATAHNLVLISDACHSIGSEYNNILSGTLADLTVFSFHPVKHITTGEGGMIVTNNRDYAEKMRRFRNHGINTDHRERENNGTWYYEMTDLGYNYRISDIQCALGISQLKRLPAFISDRREIASQYNSCLDDIDYIFPLTVLPNVYHAYHLYVVKIDFLNIGASRQNFFTALRNSGIGVNVHYLPVHLHPYYRQNYGTGMGLCPRAETAYESILSLPIYPLLEKSDVNRVIRTLQYTAEKYMTKKCPVSQSRVSQLDYHLIGENHV